MTTVAPKERVNITYKPAVAEGAGDVELPLKILMIGDYTHREDDTPIEERKPINLDADNFSDVLKEQKLGVDITVPDKLTDEQGAELSMQLQFRSLDDFTPEGIVQQVPELRKLLELRNALAALKGPLGNYPAFKKRIQALLEDVSAREALLEELGLEKGDQ